MNKTGHQQYCLYNIFVLFDTMGLFIKSLKERMYSFWLIAEFVWIHKQKGKPQGSLALIKTCQTPRKY